IARIAFEEPVLSSIFFQLPEMSSAKTALLLADRSSAAKILKFLIKKPFDNFMNGFYHKVKFWLYKCILMKSQSHLLQIEYKSWQPDGSEDGIYCHAKSRITACHTASLPCLCSSNGMCGQA